MGYVTVNDNAYHVPAEVRLYIKELEEELDRYKPISLDSETFDKVVKECNNPSKPTPLMQEILGMAIDIGDEFDGIETSGTFEERS